VANHLQGDDSVALHLTRAVDDAHAAVTDLFENLIAATSGKPVLWPESGACVGAKNGGVNVTVWPSLAPEQLSRSCRTPDT